MKRILFALLLMLCCTSMLQASAMTVDVWSDGYTIWSKTVKYNNPTDHHDARATNALYRNGGLVASGQQWGDPASITLAVGFSEGNYTSTGIGDIFCYLANGFVETTYAAISSYRTGSSIICLRKVQQTNTFVSEYVCKSRFWETATFQATYGCNVKCASEVLLTTANCSPIPDFYMMSKRWSEYQGRLQCFGTIFNLRPVTSGCTGGNCIEFYNPQP